MKWPLLAALSDDDAARVLDHTIPKRLTRGEMVFLEGDPADALYLIDSGHAAVRVTTLNGDTAMIRVLGPGQHFGELGIVYPAPRNATIAALDTLSVLALRREAFQSLRIDHPGVDSLLIEALTAETRRLTTLLSEAYYLSVPTRVALRLVELAGLYAPAGHTGPVTLPFTQEDLAQLVGTARPTANKALQGLQDEGLIQVNRGKVRVFDVDALETHTY